MRSTWNVTRHPRLSTSAPGFRRSSMARFVNHPIRSEPQAFEDPPHSDGLVQDLHDRVRIEVATSKFSDQRLTH